MTSNKNKRTATGDETLAMRVSTNTVILNVLLSVGKLIAGILAHSGAMISDAVHSASDVLSTFVVMLGIHMASKPADEKHPYGHERMECVVGVVLSVLLAVTGIGIGYSAVRSLVGGAVPQMPGMLALVAAVASIVVKEGMYHYTMAAAKKLSSPALKADAWHHRSDALSSIGSFVGILGARLGILWMDAAASLVICVFIVKVAVDIFRDAMDRMVDESGDEKTESHMRDIILGVPGVIRIDMLHTRVFGAKLYVDVEISADGELHLTQSHTIAEAVHHVIEQDFPNVKHCMVHVNPADANEPTPEASQPDDPAQEKD